MSLHFLNLRRPFRLATGMSCALMLAACSTPPKAPPPAYEAENFTPYSPFQHELGLKPEAACRVGQRALLSQGYLLETVAEQNLRATKYFQPESTHQMRLEITLVCLPVGGGTTIFASAVQTRYELKSTSANTGLSVAGVGSISLPWGADSKEAMVKVGEETVADPDFYNRLFDLIRRLAD
ncbi:MAG: DUF2242 domain-containing protein [Pseudomonadota bacterium]